MVQANTPGRAEITKWVDLRREQPGTRLRLFCFPYAGGGQAIFRGWQEKLPPAVSVCPVELPGRGRQMKEKPFSSLPPLVDALAEALAPYTDIPFAFFGHSMGALVSFELARRLRARHGVEPAHMFVSGCSAPQLYTTEHPFFDLPEPEFIEELRALNGTPEEVLAHPELLQLVLPLLRADFAVCQTYDYQPGPPLRCPVSSFVGSADEETNEARVRGWGEQTSAFFRLRVLPGDHFFLNTAGQLLLHYISEDCLRLLHRAG